jgi:hypothetical protein
MARSLLNRAAFVIGLGLTLAGCMPAAPSNDYQAQYLLDRRVCPPGSHAQTSAVSANGYWCVSN